jgi:hypothetical protein
MGIYETLATLFISYAIGWYFGYITGCVLTGNKFLAMIKAQRPKVNDLYPRRIDE